MNQLNCLLPAAFALAVTLTAHSQARPTASGPGSFVAIGVGASAFQTDYGQHHLGGAWIYADVMPHWSVGFEGEARILPARSIDGLAEASLLAGARLPVPFFARGTHGIRPYAKLLAGVSRITLPFHYGTGTFFTVAPGGGLDYNVTDRLTLRVVDFEAQRWLNFPYGELHPYGLSTGLSFRINGISTLPRHAR